MPTAIAATELETLHNIHVSLVVLHRVPSLQCSLCYVWCDSFLFFKFYFASCSVAICNHENHSYTALKRQIKWRELIRVRVNNFCLNAYAYTTLHRYTYNYENMHVNWRQMNLRRWAERTKYKNHHRHVESVDSG